MGTPIRVSMCLTHAREHVPIACAYRRSMCPSHVPIDPGQLTHLFHRGASLVSRRAPWGISMGTPILLFSFFLHLPGEFHFLSLTTSSRDPCDPFPRAVDSKYDPNLYSRPTKQVYLRYFTFSRFSLSSSFQRFNAIILRRLLGIAWLNSYQYSSTRTLYEVLFRTRSKVTYVHGKKEYFIP